MSSNVRHQHLIDYAKHINNKRKASEYTGNDNLTDTTPRRKKGKMDHMIEYSSMIARKHNNKMHAAKENAPTMEKKDSSDTHPHPHLDIYLSTHYFR